MFSVWLDTKPVLLLSNYHHPAERGTVQRRRDDGHRGDVVVPKALADYHAYMRGVDLSDQMVGYHIIHHRSKKWWRRLYFHLQMVAVHNTYVVAKESQPDVTRVEWPVFQDFVDDVALQLMVTYDRHELRL